MSDTQMMRLARAMGKEVNSRGCVLDEWYDDDLGEEVYGFITFDPANNINVEAAKTFIESTGLA